jgi:Ca2+-binding RTX toxin-like protein
MSYIGSGWDRVQATDGSYTADINGNEALTLLGRGHSDRVYDFGGVDHLNGRAGNDVLAGGAGADLFSFQTFAPQAVTR